MPSINLIIWLLALLPILLVLVLMTIFNWGGSRAGMLTWLAAQLVAVIFFGATFEVLYYSLIKAFFLSIDVLLIIWGAMFLYQVTKSAGTIQTIGSFLAEKAKSKSYIGILLGWLFPSFLQGMGGFGVPVAVSAPLLISAGFTPYAAIIITSIGHGWGVTFGSMGSSFRTLIAVTGVHADLLSHYTAVLLGITVFFSGLLVVLLSGGKRDFTKALPLAIISALILSIGQYLLATNGLWIISVTLPSLAALIVGFMYLRYFSSNDAVFVRNKSDFKDILPSFIPYLILVVLIFIFSFTIPLRVLLDPLNINIYFPELSTNFGFITPAESSRTINLALHPGSIITISAFLTIGFFHWMGISLWNELKAIIGNTFRRSRNTSIAIFALVGTATVMNHTGMTQVLAEGISSVVSRDLYPLVSPFIGALGAFITGSNNNSNVLFAGLQLQTAKLMDLPIMLILAAQTAGGAIGSIMAPAKVILGCSTAGLAGKEGRVIAKLILYCSALIAILGIFTFMFYRILE